MDDKLELPQELIDGMKALSAMFDDTERQATTMLAGFIATEEQDVDYMDRFMDQLYDFMEPLTSTEELYRKYIAYLATFDPAEAKERAEDLEDHLGYKMKIVYAAGLLARRLHAGQTDKGGHDYFTGHLLPVAKNGVDWKEKVTGFLHDAAEDCNVGVEEVMHMLDQETAKLTENPAKSLWEEDWWQDWMEDFLPYAAEETHPLTAEERAEIARTLHMMNHHTAATRAEYIDRFRGHRLAIKTKLNDLADNMDLTRIPTPTRKTTTAWPATAKSKPSSAKCSSHFNNLTKLTANEDSW